MPTDLTTDESSLAEAEREAAVARQRLAESDALLAEQADIQAERAALARDMDALRARGERLTREGVKTLTAQDVVDFCGIRDRHYRLLERSAQHRAAILLAIQPRGSA